MVVIIENNIDKDDEFKFVAESEIAKLKIVQECTSSIIELCNLCKFLLNITWTLK